MPLAEQLGPTEAPERFDPSAMHGTLVEAEHLARYWWAAGFVAGKRVLDAGCGTAYGSAILARAGATEVVAVDIDETVIEAASRSAHPGLTLERADVTKLPFADGSFDVVVCFEVIEHVDDAETVLSELSRVLRPDGLFAISSPNRAVYPPGNPHHKHEFLPDELAAALSARFEHVRLLRQHDWLGSAVLEDEAFAAGDDDTFDAHVRKASADAPGSELYTLALASRDELQATEAQVVLTETADAKWWKEKLDELRVDRDTVERTLGAQLEQREADVRSAKATARALQEKIDAMEATRVWQLGTKYWRLRDRLLRRS